MQNQLVLNHYVNQRPLNHCFLGRHNTYYFRFRTPAKILRLFPHAQKEIKKSLRTGYSNDAREKSALLYVELMKLCDAVHNLTLSSVFILDKVDINKEIQEVVRMFLESNHLKQSRFVKQSLHQVIQSKKSSGGFITTDGIHLKELQGDTEEERQQDFIRYQQYIENIVDKLPVFNKTGTQERIPASQVISFADLIAKYALYKKYNGWEDKTTYKQSLQKLFIVRELIGSDLQCSDLTTVHADKFLADIVQLPTNSNKGKMSLLSIDEKLHLPLEYKRLSKGSISKYVSLLKSITAYGISLDKDNIGGINPLAYDFAKHLSYKFHKTKDCHSYLAFTQTELQKIISGHVYQPTNPPRKRKSDSFIFWAPLIGLFSGARVNEIAQLLLTDIKKDVDTGIWYFNIMDDELSQHQVEIKQSVKTQASRRKVPIHQTLIHLGFLDFVKSKREGKDQKMLFDTGISYYDKGKWGRNISRWFNGDSSRGNGYKVDCGIERGTGKVFHSFRHTFAKNLLAKVGEHVDLSRIGALIGHEEMLSANASKITLIYTQGYNLEVLNKAINQLDYDIDLSHVSYEIFKNKHQKIHKT